MLTPRLRHALALGLAALLSIPSFANDVIRVRADPWMPFNGGEGEMPGYVIEVMERVFRPRGFTIQYQSMAWEKALAACRTGEIDAVPCANRTEGEGLTIPAETIAEVNYAVFTRKDSTWKLVNEQSFVGQKLAATPGYSYWPALDRHIANRPQEVTLLNEDDPCWDGIQKLQAKQVDLVPECPQVFYWTLRAHGMDPSSFRLGCLAPGDPVFVVFRPDAKGKAWAKLLDEGVRALRTSGELQKILKKYSVSDWK